MFSFRVARLLPRCIKISTQTSLFSSATGGLAPGLLSLHQRGRADLEMKEKNIIAPTRKFCAGDTWFAFHPLLYL